MRFGFCVCFVVNILTVTVSVWGQYAGQNLENVALQKSCNMSSRYKSTDSFPNNDCSFAINGNTGTTYNDSNCIHTDGSDHTPEWSVDLGHNYTIRNITIYDRAISFYRMTSVMVSVDNSILYTFPSSESAIQNRTDIQTNTLPRKGQRVTLTRTKASPRDLERNLLNICEVQVWACRAGYYGQACSQCRPECANSPCDDLLFPNTCPESNQCNSNPCPNDRPCQRERIGSEERFTCLCKEGFTGNNCENDIDECSGVSCANGGTCINQIGSYMCACSQGYTGQHCESDIDECGTVSCVNGGTCINYIGSYICVCHQGYPSQSCENDRSDACNLTGPVVGAVMGAGALIAASIVLVFCWRSRQKGKAGGSNGERTTTQEGTMQVSTVSSSLDPPSASVGPAKPPGVEIGPDSNNYESLSNVYVNGVAENDVYTDLDLYY